MTPTEAISYQIKNLKGKSLKQKFEHILTYYWMPILLVVIVLIFAASYIVHISTMKDPALLITCINGNAEQDQTETYITEFARQADIDLDQYEVTLSTDIVISNEDLMSSYDALQVLIAQIAAQSVDMIVSDRQILSSCIYEEIFVDLSQVLTLEQQARFEPYYLYMDVAIVKEMQTFYEGPINFPDPTKPELMSEPVPVALLLPKDGQFPKLCFSNDTDEVAVGILRNSLNTTNTLLFLNYIMK